MGEEIAVSDWLEVTQARINQFADATGNHQWIHVDPCRAAAELPSKTTIAHGFLTLSLLSTLIRESIRLSGFRMAINYGLNRVRFVWQPACVWRIRALITLQAVDAVSDGVQVTWLHHNSNETGVKNRRLSRSGWFGYYPGRAKAKGFHWQRASLGLPNLG